MEQACGFDACVKPSKYAALLLCSGCRAVWYCDRECQKGDWKGHKAGCRTAQEELSRSHLVPAGKVATHTATPNTVQLDIGTAYLLAPEEVWHTVAPVDVEGEAAKRPLLTIVLAGVDGIKLATSGAPDIRLDKDEKGLVMSGRAFA
jgi:hypothetical protein